MGLSRIIITWGILTFEQRKKMRGSSDGVDSRLNRLAGATRTQSLLYATYYNNTSKTLLGRVEKKPQGKAGKEKENTRYIARFPRRPNRLFSSVDIFRFSKYVILQLVHRAIITLTVLVAGIQKNDDRQKNSGVVLRVNLRYLSFI